ncbi:hypothetical protein [uncultured Erythrobacter sp.]|uniref:hypothetical protein n=1 Tax=uncultured Erythrobacter sp. TaxID=263913 RepID=UPI00262EE4E6|nr:hypothetical protein [uncultured Erythrobacter sp.]
MDSDLLIIFSGIVLALIVIGMSINGIVSKVLAHERKMQELKHSPQSHTDAVLGDRTDLIEDRLRVLERLATDRGALLSDEIEALRLDVAERREKEEG